MWLINRLNQLNRGTLTVAGVILAIILFLATNMLVALLPTVRLDLTQDQLFTPTDSTVKVLADVKEPITLHIYQSSALINSAPSLRVFSQRVNEILRRYEDLSGGKVHIDRVDPLPFSPDEDRALGYDLQGINLNQAGDRGYFGLVGTNSVDQVETVKFFDPQRESFLEYDLTRIVNRLSSPHAPKVAVIDGLGIFGDAQQQRYPRAVLQLINRNFDIQQVNLDVDALPDGIDGLMIVHPYALTPRAAYAVDQYVLNGGPAVVFVDPLAENSTPNPQKPAEPMFPSSNLPELMKAWGIEMPVDKIVGDRDMAIRVVTAAPGGRQIAADYLPWLQVRKDQMNSTDIVTSRLTLLRVGSAGVLRPIAGAQTSFTPLIFTTTNSTLLDLTEVKSHPNPQTLLDKFKPSGTRMAIAARISGPANTAFPGGQPAAPPPTPDQQQKPPAPARPQLLKSVKPVNLIVVADTDMLTDNYVVNDSGQVNSNNSDFIINTLDNITGGSALLGLRGRGLSFRPFTEIERREGIAQTKYQNTEESLQQELDNAQAQLKALQDPRQSGQPVEFRSLTQAQQETVTTANRRIVQLREQLRDVRAALNSDIDQLETRLKFLNILLVPGIVVLIGILIAVWRRMRLARYIKGQSAA